ncbi:chorismate mutase [Mycobacterium sp. 3519A]|uniref:chorismate mutase n=1 Tax=Mycobacterium sp. 3519A TaxID=2057184 RepID=UPI000C79D556|nr:chorismate mutase [Mycobacterium sp. 3519A]
MSTSSARVSRALATVLVIAPLVVAGATCATAGADQIGPLIKLVDDAALRLQTADPVAASKYRTGGAVDDPVREGQVIDAVTAAAADRHIDTEFVRRVFRDQIDATDSLEHSRFAQWKIDPASAPKTAPDLTSSRDVINRLNTEIVQDIADQQDALRGLSCPADLQDAKNAAIAKEHLDELYQRALDYAVHDYCH